jgi:hypothetical protein
MTKEREQQIYKNMDDVIDTSKGIRDYLLNDSIPQEDKVEKFEFFKQALIANKNIVSATGTQLAVERITKRSYEENNK